MDENNDTSRFNTILGVEEDKSVGSKIKNFVKKFNGIPENREVRLTSRANFNKVDEDLQHQLKKWEKFSKRQIGNPLVNTLFGDKNRVKATKRVFAELEATAKKSSAKYNARLNALQGMDRKSGKGSEIGDVQLAIDKNQEKINKEKNRQDRVTNKRDTLLEKQKQVSLFPNERNTLERKLAEQNKIAKLNTEKSAVIDDKKNTKGIATANINNDAKKIISSNEELLKLAAGYFGRTNDDSLFKKLKMDIVSTSKEDKRVLDEITTELNSAKGKKGGISKKLKSKMKEYTNVPTTELMNEIDKLQAELSAVDSQLNDLSLNAKYQKKKVEINEQRKQDFDNTYKNRYKPQDYAINKDYRDDEFIPKFQKAKRTQISATSKFNDNTSKRIGYDSKIKSINNEMSMVDSKIKMLMSSMKNVIPNKELDKLEKHINAYNDILKSSKNRLSDNKKHGERLTKEMENLKNEVEDINEQLGLWAGDMKTNPFNSVLKARDAQKINDEIDDINVKSKKWYEILKKSNFATRLMHRIMINIRSQIADMINPLTNFRKGWDAWLGRFDNLPWKNTFDVIAYNLVTAFEPVFEWLAKSLIKVAQIANVFIQRWTGVNLFDKSAWQLEQIKKGMGQLTASFDELHSSNDNPNQFNTIFDTDAMAVSPLDAGLENSLVKFADNVKKVFDNVWGFIKKHPLASAGIALATWLFGPKLLKAGAKLLGKGLKQLLFGSSTKDAAEKGGSLLGGLFGKTLYTGMNGKTVTVGKLLGGIALTAGGTALAISSAADAGKNWEDMTNTQKAVKVGFVGIGSAAAGLGAVMLGATGPVGWAVAGAVALGSLVVGMSQVQNGIGSLKEETKEWEETQQNMNKALDIANQADQIYGDSLAELKRLEEQTGESGKELYDAVERGILTTDDMTYSQTLVYNAYKKTQKALEDQTVARKKANELVRKEAKDQTDIIFKNAKESGSYDELAKHINTCWENGTMTTEQARDEISRCMAGMSETARNELLGKLQPALQQGLDYEKYQSGWNEFGRFWENLWTNAVGVHDQSMANMKATEEDLLETTDKLKEAQENLKKAQEELTQAEQNAGMTWEELRTKLDNGEIAINNLTDAQRKLYDAHTNVSNSSTLVDQAMEKNGQNVIGVAKKAYEASGDWKKYAETLIKANNDGQLSTEDMEREIGDSLGRLSGDERKYAEDWLNENNRMTNGVRQACNKQEGFFRNMLSNIGKWISQKTAEWGDWWADILPGGETSQSRQVKREIENIQNNPYYSEEEKRRLINNLSATMPSYAVGTNYVPNDQLAMIHQGEAIIPKKYNKPYSPQSSSSELESTISAMTQEIANLRNLVQQGIPVKGEFRQRGSDLVAVVEKGKNKNGNQTLSNPAYAR